VYIGEAVDINALLGKFRKNLEKDRKFIALLEEKLARTEFIKNAPAELVEGEKLKLAEAKERTGKIETYIRNMENT
jgi:valyl-tRNA synthetase